MRSTGRLAAAALAAALVSQAFGGFTGREHRPADFLVAGGKDRVLGDPGGGPREREDAVRIEPGPLLRAGLEYQAVYHGAGARTARPGLYVSDQGAGGRPAGRGGTRPRAAAAGGRGRSEPLRTRGSLPDGCGGRRSPGADRGPGGPDRGARCEARRRRHPGRRHLVCLGALCGRVGNRRSAVRRRAAGFGADPERQRPDHHGAAGRERRRPGGDLAQPGDRVLPDR